MKIKLLKDIPGYKAGEILEVTSSLNWTPSDTPSAMILSIEWLIANGWAEEVKDEIDMEEMRKKFTVWNHTNFNLAYPQPQITKEEGDFFTAYRIVKHVTDTLNGDWKSSWGEREENVTLSYRHNLNKFVPEVWCRYQYSIIPAMKNLETAEKVISLCEPELKILFNVK